MNMHATVVHPHGNTNTGFRSLNLLLSHKDSMASSTVKVMKVLKYNAGWLSTHLAERREEEAM